MRDDNMESMAKTTEAMGQLDKTQEMLECTAYDILNCSDSIRNTLATLIEFLIEIDGIDLEKKKTVNPIGDCLEELCAFTENLSRCAHSNEEEFSKQHEVIEELKSIFIDNHYDLF